MFFVVYLMLKIYLFNIGSEIMIYHDGKQFLGKDCEAKNR